MAILTRGGMKNSGGLETAIQMPQSQVSVTICVCPYPWVGKQKALINQMFLLGKEGFCAAGPQKIFWN